jgi:glycosyltransferase involved in cell wall biosynthesis
MEEWMKIVFVGTTADSVLGFRAALIKTLVYKNCEVYVFALDYNEASREKVKLLGAIPMDYEFSRAGLNPFSDVLNTLRLSRQLRALAPTVVFSYFSKPVVFATFAAFLAGIKRRIGMLEGLGYAFTERPGGLGFKAAFIKYVQIFLYWLAFPLLERLIFLNPDDPVDLVQKHHLHVRHIDILGGIGVELAAYPYSAPPTATVSFLFIGRLLAEKGINEYVKAAQLVKSAYPTACFVVLGGLDEMNPGGLSSSALMALVDSGVIDYPGHVDNVAKWISAASVFVLPSYREGMPRSTQEAMAIGRPVITCDVPGCRETVVDGVNGFLIPPWSAEKLAEKMIFFIKNTDQIGKMGIESYKIAQEKFDAHIVNKKLLGYFGVE